MTGFQEALTGTPIYAWCILAYLLWRGIKGLRTRTVYLPQLFIIPIAFMLLKFQRIFSADAKAFWLALCLGALAGLLLHAWAKIKILPKAHWVEVPGHPGTLILLLAFFGFQYYLGYLKSRNPTLYLQYAFLEPIASGLLSGYFIGRGLRSTYACYKAWPRKEARDNGERGNG